MKLSKGWASTFSTELKFDESWRRWGTCGRSPTTNHRRDGGAKFVWGGNNGRLEHSSNTMDSLDSSVQCILQWLIAIISEGFLYRNLLESWRFGRSEEETRGKINLGIEISKAQNHQLRFLFVYNYWIEEYLVCPTTEWQYSGILKYMLLSGFLPF
jgi:hypothetical protein